MVLLGVDTEAQLLQWTVFCSESGLPHGLFVEPDIGDQATALAVLPTDPKVFGRLKLLR